MAMIDLAFFLGLGIAFGLIGFFRGFHVRTRKKLIENIPTSTVRGMAVGLVEIQGMARPFQGILKTPFSKVESVFFHYKIEEHQGSGKSSRWVTIKEFTTPGWFFLEDETGKVLINPIGAELYLAADRKYQMGSLGGGADVETFEEGLNELGISSHGFFGFDKQLRCVEHFICPGDAVYIMGMASENPMVKGSATGFENLCIQKEGAPFFCISDQSEKELLASMGWRMYLYLYGGPVLAVTCLVFLIQYYFFRIF